jgi:hypothetical protein
VGSESRKIKVKPNPEKKEGRLISIAKDYSPNMATPTFSQMARMTGAALRYKNSN